MRCDQCGRQIESGEKASETTVEVDPRAGPTVYGAVTRTKSLTLCASCAARRNATQRFFMWGIALVVGGLILAAILAQVAK